MRVYDIDGFKFMCAGEDITIVEECIGLPDKGEYHFDEHLKRQLHDVTGWIDIGAHIGGFSIAMAKKYNVPIVACEALPSNCDLLAENVKLNGVGDLIDIYEYAIVPDDVESVAFNVHPKYSSAGSLERSIRGGTSLTVPALSMTQLLADCADLDCMKIDVEGAESKLVAAANFSNIRVLIVEYHMFITKDLEDFYTMYHKVKQEFDVVTVRTVLRKFGKMLAYITAYKKG